MSNGAATSATSAPSPSAALKSRAPSRWTASPAARAAAAAAAMRGRGTAIPSCVFSRLRSRLTAKWESSAFTAAVTVAGSSAPSGATGTERSATPPSTEAPAAS